jgi:DNA-binding ferritin-like protein
MKLLTPFLKIQNQLRIFHWQTSSYAQHKAFGKAYEQLDGYIDDFVEVFMGKYGRSKAATSYSIELENLGSDYLDVIDSFISYLIGITDSVDPVTDTDLLNIKDSMIGELNRLKYLLTLD